MFWCLISYAHPAATLSGDAYRSLLGMHLCLQSPVLGQVGPLAINIIPISLLHHPFSTSSGSFSTPVGPIHCSEASPGNPQLWKDSSQVSVIAFQVEEAGRGDPQVWLQPGSPPPVNPGLPDTTTPRTWPGSPVPGYPAGPFSCTAARRLVVRTAKRALIACSRRQNERELALNYTKFICFGG